MARTSKRVTTVKRVSKKAPLKRGRPAKAISNSAVKLGRPVKVVSKAPAKRGRSAIAVSKVPARRGTPVIARVVSVPAIEEHPNTPTLLARCIQCGSWTSHPDHRC